MTGHWDEPYGFHTEKLEIPALLKELKAELAYNPVISDDTWSRFLLLEEAVLELYNSRVLIDALNDHGQATTLTSGGGAPPLTSRRLPPFKRGAR